MESPKVLGKALVQAFAERGPDVPRSETLQPPAAGARRLVIVREFSKKGLRLLYCDDEWQVLSEAEVNGLSEALERSESEFPGISEHWHIRNYSESDLEPADREPRCSFCSQPYYRVQGIIEGEGAHICYECVRNLGDLVARHQ